MNIKINRNNETPIYLQIRNEIKKKIISDELPSGYKLPAERSLADDLGVSRNTVVSAYQRLIADGFVVNSSKPKGYFVGEIVRFTPQKFFSPLSKMIKYRYTENENLFDDIFQKSDSIDCIPFAGIFLNPEILKDEESKYSLFYGFDKRETVRLKGNICKLLKRKNIFVSEKNIQIVSETTQALDYITELYLKAGDYIIVEEPVVADTVNVFRNKGVKIAYARMENDGVDIENMEALINKYNPKFIYTMPTYHNPTGIIMSMEKRIKLLQLAHYYGIPIIEDGSLSDFYYDGPDYTPLVSLDQSHSVLYIDSFTLTFLPGIKTGYVVGPVEPVSMIERLIVTNQTMVYNIGHAILNESIEDGSFENRVLKLQDYYRKKRDYFCSQLENLREFGISFDKPHGGLFVWCSLSKKINEKKLFQASKERGLLYMPGSVYYPEGNSDVGKFRLCFSYVSDRQIDCGMQILKEAIMESYDESYAEKDRFRG